MTNEIINPYIAGAPVTEVSMFFGREDVFDWIQNSLAGKYADHILVIHGQRRVGKTSVLKQLGNKLPEKYIPVFFDLQGRTHTTLDRFLWWLARETVRVLKLERNIDVPVPQREDFARDPEYFETVFLPHLQPFLGDKVLLYTFDEFDNLEESSIKEELAIPLIDHLRRLMGRPEMSFIYSIGSSGRKLENMQAAYTEFFKTALYKKISFLSEEQTRNLIIRPVEGVIEFDRSATKHIYDLASGHPYFTQLTCHELFAHCQRTDQRRIKDEDVREILDDVVERGTVNLKFTWDEASDIEKWCLAALAQIEKTDNNTLSNFLRKERVRFADSDLTSSLLHLKEKDVLTSKNRFVIYLLKIWLKKNRPMDQVREELTEVNPIANRYIEIGLEFKDAGYFDKALESFEEALTIAPGNLQAQVNIGMILMIQEAFDKAVVEFEKALIIDDEDVVARGGVCDANLALGDSALARGRTKEAILSYQRVLSINREHLEARHRMADIIQRQAEKLLQSGKDEEALNAFSEALEYTPEDFNLIQRVEQVKTEKKAKVLAALATRAEKELRLRNWDKAIALLTEAHNHSPEDATLLEKIDAIKNKRLEERLNKLLIMADQAEAGGNWDTSIAALSDYLVLNPEDEKIKERVNELVEGRHAAWLKAVLDRSGQAVSNGRWDDAVSILNEVLSLEPDNAEIQIKVTEIHAAQRKAKLDALLKRANLAVHNGQWEDAISALNEGLAAEPENQQILQELDLVREARRSARLNAVIRLAETSAQSKKWDAAIQTLTETLVLEPENIRLQQKLAEIKTQHHEYKIKTLHSQAATFTKGENYEAAITAWREILSLDPENTEQIQQEIKGVLLAQKLSIAYGEAKKAFVKKNYERTISFLKEVIQQDVNYKDAPLLFAQAVEMRKAHPWWKKRWLQATVILLILFLILWTATRFGLFSKADVENLAQEMAEVDDVDAPLTEMSTEQPGVISSTSEPETTVTPEIFITPTHIPVNLPYNWVRINSGSFLERDQVTAIAIDRNDSGVIFIGTENSGVYKSIDGGLSWQPSNEGLTRADISTLIIDPNNSSVIYASVDVGGVFKTTDGANTWESVSNGIELPGGEDFGTLVMDPDNSLHLFFSQRTGLYETENGGDHWKQIQIPSCLEEITNLVISPNDGNTLFISELISANDDRICDNGIFKSIDGGETWEFLEINFPADENVLYNSLSISTNNPNLIYISTDRRFFVSDDGGNSWQNQDQHHCLSLAFSLENGKTFCGDYRNLWVSENGGLDWMKSLTVGHESGFSSMANNPGNGMIFAGHQGVYSSTDDGILWESHNNGIGSGFTQILSHPAYENNLFLLDNNMQIHGSQDGGLSWEIWEGDSQALFITGPNEILGNDTYTQFASTSSTIRYAVGPRVQNTFLSKDGGSTWEACSQDPITELFASETLSALVIDPRDDNKLFIASEGGGIFYSDDACQSWVTKNYGLGSLVVNSIAIDIDNSDTLFAGTESGAYISLDYGETWNEINDGLLGVTVIFSITIDADRNVYAASPYGIFILERK